MIFGKIWRSIRAQLNKLSNWFSGVDPVAQLQYEYDNSVEELKSGREGLAQYRALVERVTRQVEGDRQHVSLLEGKVRAYLKINDRENAARFALELKKAKDALGENEKQLGLHEQAYSNHLLKIKHAGRKLADLQDRIHKYDAELKMSRAEAEMAELAKSFDFDVTTDFGQIERVIEDKISMNRAKVRVAADLSSQGVEEVQHEMAVEQAMADQALQEFEQQAGLAPPATTPPVAATTKALP